MSDRESNEKLVNVHTVTSEAEAEIVRGYLEANGIRAIMTSTMAHSVYPFTVDGLAEIKLLVKRCDEEKAVELLRQIESGESDFTDVAE